MLCALRHADNCPDVRPQLAQAHELWLLLFCSPPHQHQVLTCHPKSPGKGRVGAKFRLGGA